MLFKLIEDDHPREMGPGLRERSQTNRIDPK